MKGDSSITQMDTGKHKWRTGSAEFSCCVHLCPNLCDWWIGFGELEHENTN